MKNYFYNITNGQPKSILPAFYAAMMDGFTKIIPAILLVDVFHTIYRSFEYPEQGLQVHRLWIVSGVLLVWLVVQFITSARLYNQTFYASYSVAASGRIKLAEHLRKLSLGFLGKRDPGDLTNLLLTDYGQVEHTISHNVSQLMSSLVMPILTFIGLLFIDWRMAIAMFISLPLGIMIVWGTNKMQVKLSKDHIEAKNDTASRLQEYLGGIREIKAHNIGGERFERLRSTFERLMSASIRIEALIGPIVITALVIIRSGLTVMILLGAYLLLNGSLTLPIFLLFLLIGNRVFEPLTVSLINYAEIRYSAYSAERIMAVMHEETPTGTETTVHGGPIHFDHVSFKYDEHYVLHNVHLTIPERSITALVGPSGSGKSTITELIARFWDVQEGAIRIGDQSIATIDPEALLKEISMVFQDVYLFNDTIRNNILIGNQEATDEEVEEAARKACCHDFIASLPEGYDTLVGEGGSTLSGGEKQRISIARALLKNASIVLLDEATASLDPENEIAVQQAINALVEEKTVIIIAHRLKTIQYADQIVVLNEGRIIERGQHDDLVKQEGLYAKLWGLQQNAETWTITGEE